ncbi:MAG TPA: M14 metallopeptidase family protein [Gemmatimonadaceae bacterium]
MRSRSFRLYGALVLPLALAAGVAQAQGHVTTPKQHFGHDIGDDYWLPNYDQYESYLKTIARESNRARLVDIGKTAEGRTQYTLIVSAPENIRNLEHYRQIEARLARAEGLTDAQAHQLAEEGKAVVWIDGGLHATEVLGANQLIQTEYDLLTRTDPETMRILRDDIVLLTNVNPDGMQLVANWYMQEPDSLKRNENIPRLYEKYAGHDDNRDFYMANLPETQNEEQVMFWEWYPIIVYNHHQTGPAGAVVFTPPFRDPFNYVYDPLLVMDIDMVGSAMHTRFAVEGKPGFTMRSGSSYSTWWDGGLRTSVYFHNMIGLLTETIGNPTPTRIPFVPAMQLPHGDLPYPVEPQEWHFRQSIDYMVTANYAVLDIASRRRDEFLYGLYRMGRNSIDKGNRDSWTVTPTMIAAVDSAVARAGGGRGAAAGGRGGRGGAASDAMYQQYLRDPALRDPRGYIMPSDQPDFATVTRFVNSLRYNGVDVLRATAGFTVDGKRYPKGSYVVKTAQAFRPQVLDMFEPQDYPNDFAYPGGPPIRPYDNAGWTLAFQMGVRFDRILTAFDGPFEKVDGLAQLTPAEVAGAAGARGFVFSHAENNAFTAINRLLAAGADVYWLRSPLSAGGTTYPAGTFYVAASSAAQPVVQAAARTLGVRFTGVPAPPGSGAVKLHPQRIALYDQYGGSMPSGWTRFELEQFEFPYHLIFPKELDAGNLNAKYDVIIFVDAAFQGGAGGSGRGGRGFGGRTADVPAQYQYMLGSLTADHTVPQLETFMRNGGTVIAVGASTNIAYDLQLPLENQLTERTPAGEVRPLTGEQFYVPGSLLTAAVDSTSVLGAGMPGHVDVFFQSSPVFRLNPDAAMRGVTPVAWFDTATPLHSGWAWGQGYLQGGVAAAAATIGRGQLYLLGPEILFRGQPHGTFKFLFNGIYGGER